MNDDNRFYYFTTEILNDPNISFSRPKYNDNFMMNISGMTFKQLADCLRLVAECIDIGTEGNDWATADYELPFLDPSIESRGKFLWEDGYDESHWIGIRLFESLRKTEDGSAMRLSSDIKQATADGKTISEFIRNKFGKETGND